MADNVVELNQRPPCDHRILLAHHIPVAGISQPDVKANAEKFVKGWNQSIRLERNPGNPHDPDAIKVIACRGRKEAQIGFVPRDVAERLAKIPAVSLAATIDVLFKPTAGKGAGLRICIWGWGDDKEERKIRELYKDANTYRKGGLTAQALARYWEMIQLGEARLWRVYGPDFKAYEDVAKIYYHGGNDAYAIQTLDRCVQFGQLAWQKTVDAESLRNRMANGTFRRMRPRSITLEQEERGS